MGLFSVDFLVLVSSVFVFVRMEKYFQFTHLVLRGISFFQAVGKRDWDNYLESTSYELKRKSKGTKTLKKTDKSSRITNLPLFMVTIEDTTNPVLHGLNFLEYLEYTISISGLGIWMYLISNCSCCLLDRSNTSSTSLFLASCAFLCYSMLYSLTTQLWSEETSLSVLTGIFSAFFCLGMFGAVPMPAVLDFPVSEAVEEVASLSGTSETFAWWTVVPALSIVSGFWTYCSLLGALRYARSYSEFALDSNKLSQRLLNLWRHVVMFSPLIVSLLWVEPIVAKPFTLISGLSINNKNQMRFYVSAILCFARLLYFRAYMRTYIDSVRYVVDDMIKEPKIFGVEQIRRAVDNNYKNICTAGVQYLAPTMTAISLLLLSSRLDANSSQACDLLRSSIGLPKFSGNAVPETSVSRLLKATLSSLSLEEEFEPKLPETLTILLVNFFFWWINFTWFVFSIIGVIYWNVNFRRSTKQRMINWAKMYGTLLNESKKKK